MPTIPPYHDPETENLLRRSHDLIQLSKRITEEMAVYIEIRKTASATAAELLEYQTTVSGSDRNKAVGGRADAK